MARNYIQPGKTLTLVAPYARSSGEGAMVGSVFGVALNDVENAAEGEFGVEGVWELAKTSAQAWTQGDRIYWNAGTKKADNDPETGRIIGVATADAANPSSTGSVRLNGAVSAMAEGPQDAIVALTDNTGDSGTHDDTLADGVTVGVALTDNSGGGATDGTIAVITNAANAGSADVQPTADAIAELATRCNTLRADSLTHNQNISDLAQKINEIRTALIAAGILTA